MKLPAHAPSCTVPWSALWWLALAGPGFAAGPSTEQRLGSGAAAQTNAHTNTGTTPSPLLEGLLQGQNLLTAAARALAPENANVVVLPGLPDPRLRLAPCAVVEGFVPSGVKPWGSTRLGLRCTTLSSTAPVGSQRWRITLPATVKVFAPAPVAVQALAANAVLDASHWTMALVDWAASPTAPLATADNLNGRSLLRPVAAGQPLRAVDLRARRWFSSGDTVRILASGPGFAVAGEGQALSDGMEGGTARARLENGTVVRGRPTAERQLEVSL